MCQFLFSIGDEYVRQIDAALFKKRILFLSECHILDCVTCLLSLVNSCVCVHAWVRLWLWACTHACVCVRVCVCVCVWVYAFVHVYMYLELCQLTLFDTWFFIFLNPRSENHGQYTHMDTIAPMICQATVKITINLSGKLGSSNKPLYTTVFKEM